MKEISVSLVAINSGERVSFDVSRWRTLKKLLTVHLMRQVGDDSRNYGRQKDVSSWTAFCHHHPGRINCTIFYRHLTRDAGRNRRCLCCRQLSLSACHVNILYLGKRYCQPFYWPDRHIILVSGMIGRYPIPRRSHSAGTLIQGASIKSIPYDLFLVTHQRLQLTFEIFCKSVERFY